MSLFISSLNSGSNGNCYYVGTKDEAILIDAGLTCKETELRLERLGLAVEKIKAIFISHEHSDHIKGLKTLSNKHKLPVYITPKTLQNSKLKLNESLVSSFDADSPIKIGKLEITAFSKHHDAIHPHSFTVASKGVRVAVITDIGHACKKVVEHFSQCHAAFLEANYDEEMLDKGHYPLHLKKRIKSKVGHLSNAQALELVKKYRAPYLSHLFLAHLSQENNSVDLVQTLFQKHALREKIIVAPRTQETALYSIHLVPGAKNSVKINPVQTTQLSLF